MCEQTDKPAQNTDKILWREEFENRPSNNLFLTEGGGIGMSVDGMTIVMPMREWHRLAYEHSSLTNA